MKYNKKIVDKIVSLLESGDYTQKDICEQVGIHVDTWHEWKKSKPEFSELIDAAHERRMEIFKNAARRGLLLLLEGKEYEEVTTEFVEGKPGKAGEASKPKIKSQKKVKKFIMPNAAAVTFALKNLDSDNFIDVVRQEQTGKGGGPIKHKVERTLVFKNYGTGKK